jgi:hypothetical protein
MNDDDEVKNRSSFFSNNPNFLLGPFISSS